MTRGPILAVDDDPQTLAAIRQILSDQHALAFATSGSTALKVIEKTRPRLILLDIRMPDVDGHTLCRQIKADPRNAQIPVIFVTSLSDAGNEAEGFAAGAVDYISKPLSPAVVRARVHTHLSLVGVNQLETSYREAISMLGAAGHYNDTDTGGHIWRMAAYARALAEASGWRQDACDTLENAAPMHDTGKIGIPGHILRKPAKLDAQEWATMKTHTTIGHAILNQSDAPVFRMAAEVALRHHEKWDGSGYPDGLRGEDIPESARIVALADVFDALTMKRPYKEAWPLARTMATIREGAGSHFEPRLVACFESILEPIMRIKATWDSRE